MYQSILSVVLYKTSILTSALLDQASIKLGCHTALENFVFRLLGYSF